MELYELNQLIFIKVLKQCLPHSKCLTNCSSFINLFIYFWQCCVFIAARGLSLVAVRGGYSSWWCVGFSLQWLLLLQSTGSRHVGFSTCGVWAQQLWCTGLVAPRHVGSSRTRARTHVLCIGRRILNHWATREAQSQLFLLFMPKLGKKTFFPSTQKHKCWHLEAYFRRE